MGQEVGQEVGQEGGQEVKQAVGQEVRQEVRRCRPTAERCANSSGRRVDVNVQCMDSQVSISIRSSICSTNICV